jgi:hypothetical protein
MSAHRILICLLLLTSCAMRGAEEYESVTEAQIKTITFEDCEIDNDRVGPVSADVTHLKNEQLQRFEKLVGKLNVSKLNTEKHVGQRVRNLIGTASFVDASRSEFEGEMAYQVFEMLKRDVPKESLIKACAWIALKPEAGSAIRTLPDLGYDFEMDEQMLRDRSTLYARKLLGRLLGKLTVKK